MERNLILQTDSYKTSQFLQYPANTTKVFSYIESRGGAYDETVMFGLQYLIKEYLTKPITQNDIDKAEKFLSAHGMPFNKAGWQHILDRHQGRLPLLIRAVEEGKVVPTRNILVAVENTDPECFWLTSYVETLLLKVWYPITVATTSYKSKKVIKKYLEQTGDVGGLPFKLHDFGYRGVSSEESAALGGAAHLVNFMGTDTMAAPLLLSDYYKAEAMTGYSIPASEHSTITSWGKENEIEAYRNMLKQFRTSPILACVSDSYNLWEALKMWKELESEMAEGQILVVRPDSGPVVETAVKTVVELSKLFGFSINAKGYKVLNKVRVIYGDGISEVSVIESILNNLTAEGFSADNIAFGMGGGLLQKCDRDTLKFAMKCSAIVVNEDGIETVVDVYKDPITDPGKTSKKGFLDLIKIDGKYHTVTQTNESLIKSELKIVFKDGSLLNEISIDKIRNNAKL
jgi:nicotinamide phosphoribosyltransferase